MNFWHEKTERQKLLFCLGIFWTLDAILQLQPKMFTSTFANQVLRPASNGQPLFVHGPMDVAIKLILMHPFFWNVIFVAIQLSIGLLLCLQNKPQMALRVSVVWALFVWFLGEGLGGMLSGNASILMGLPGAALLYAFIALAVFPKDKKNPDTWLSAAWCLLWLVGAFYQLLPGQNTVSDNLVMVQSNLANAPRLFLSFEKHIVNLLQTINHGQAMSMSTGVSQSSGLWLILLLFAVQVLIGISVFLARPIRNCILFFSIPLCILFWLIGQNLGGLSTGLATDPSTAPLFILIVFFLIVSDRYSVEQFMHDFNRQVRRFDELLT